jgi:hypothetical protein
MARRTTISPDVIADILVTSRRRCCICFALAHDSAEKKGQVTHLDRDASNSSAENLVFLCLNHHDQYDSHTSQSKGLSIVEVKRYRAQLERFVAKSLPLSDADIARALLAGLDRPAFRTPFHQESSLPRFKAAIAETIATINTGKTPSGTQLPAKNEVRDPTIREGLDGVVERLVALRSAFDELLRTNEIRHCGCQDPDCPVFMLSDRAVREMDRRRHDLLVEARKLDPAFPRTGFITSAAR